MADQLTIHIKVLTEGKNFSKYCYNSNKISGVHAYFSMDFKFFAWKSSNDKDPTVQPMTEFREIKLGKTSKNFKKYLKKGEDPEDFKSFSLVF